MRTRTFAACFLAITFVMTIPLPTSAQQEPAEHQRYRAVDLGTLGGPSSGGCVPGCRYLNNEGAAVFNADTPAPDPFSPNYCLVDCFATLGVNWQAGLFTDLNPLPGGGDTYPLWISDTGSVAGISENGQLDPATGLPQVIATLWHGGNPISLGTLGGTESVALSVNSSGQVVGGATNSTPDPLANAFFNYSYFAFPTTTETHAFLWQNGTLHDLHTLGGPDSFATAVNEQWQVAGFSFVNTVVNPTTGTPTLDPFLWGDWKMKDLGTLGGTVGLASGLNNRGQVIGRSNLAGDNTFHPFLWTEDHLVDLKTLGGNNGSAIWINDAGQIVGWADLQGSQVHHAFLWELGTMKDLGTVGGDACSTAYGVNSRGQIVGDSGPCGGSSVHAFLWASGGPMVDLSTLFAPLSSGLQLWGACCIANGGEILGTGRLPNGDDHAMLLIPCDGEACSKTPVPWK